MLGVSRSTILRCLDAGDLNTIEARAQLGRPPVLHLQGARVDVVFMGDSITEGWARTDAAFFSNGIVGRGISAQTTPQMLVRMHADVIALKPRVLHIMAGTNDIAGNTGPMSPGDTQNNFMAMCEIARAQRQFGVVQVEPVQRDFFHDRFPPCDGRVS